MAFFQQSHFRGDARIIAAWRDVVWRQNSCQRSVNWRCDPAFFVAALKLSVRCSPKTPPSCQKLAHILALTSNSSQNGRSSHFPIRVREHKMEEKMGKGTAGNVNVQAVQCRSNPSDFGVLVNVLRKHNLLIFAHFSS